MTILFLAAGALLVAVGLYMRSEWRALRLYVDRERRATVRRARVGSAYQRRQLKLRQAGSPAPTRRQKTSGARRA